uniref:Glucagon-like peptide 1 receptor n=1 Tax=Callorhinchus milii TaxID=7868 RepID=A0A4W3HSE2_CALMI
RLPVKLFCNRTFDMYICWPDGFPGTTVNVSCPWYLPWDRYAFRYCSDNGSWLLDLVSQGPWADSSQCAEDDAFLHQHSIQRKLRFVYTAGYTLSLISLVAANLTLISLRKLRCTRNYIHVNLFSSFILRAISSCEALWRGRLCICSCILLLQVPCRAAQLLLHYSVASSWYWLLVEGIFLYTLLVLSVFSPTKSYRLYLMIGWGMAEGISVITPPPFSHLPLQSLYPPRHTTYNYIALFTQGSINVAIFVRIMMLLISKMRSHQMQNTDFRYRLTKSTLILIPMLGVHEIVLALVTDEMAEGTLRYLKLSVELFFGSVQVQTLLHTFSVGFTIRKGGGGGGGGMGRCPTDLI